MADSKAARRLSEAQRQFLRDLLTYYTRGAAGPFGVLLADLRHYRREGSQRTRADSAAFSRMLASLERRGLIARHSWTGGRRTTDLVLTPLGRQVAELVNIAESSD